MLRLCKVDLSGFRGALVSLPIEFSRDCRSIAIFGENTAGKSSITDAIEWFYKDRVDHLWHEHCKESSLRNVLLPDNQNAHVKVGFSNPHMDSTKTLTSTLHSSYSNSSQEFIAYLTELGKGQERLALRNFELLSFVVSTKTEKREYLAKIIGYEALDDFKDVIQRTQTQLERDPAYVSAKKTLPQYQGDILSLAGTMVTNDAELHQTAQRLSVTAGAKVNITDDASYSVALNTIRAQITQQDKAQRKLALSELKQACDSLLIKVSSAKNSSDTFLAVYGEIQQSKEELRQIKLESLLSQGKTVIDAGLAEPDTCPLCLQPKSFKELSAELSLRLDKLRESKRKYQDAVTKKDQALRDLTEVSRTAVEVSTRASRLELSPSFASAVQAYKSAVEILIAAVNRHFNLFEPLTSAVSAETETLIPVLSTQTGELVREMEALQVSQDEQRLIDLLRNLDNLRTTYRRYADASRTRERFERQIATLETVKVEFVRVHSSTLQQALSVMSRDISHYYLSMHPHENVEDMELAVIDEGIEFRYRFHGKLTFPPLKFLSESHLNSLGIAAFLASAKLFNKHNRFFILDDIVTSFDAGHRLQLLRLLKDEFQDWQILLLTHEPFWFEMIKKELLPVGWLAQEVELLPGIGIQIKGFPKNLKDLIAQKSATATLVPNDLRILLEKLLKEICRELEVKLAFRYNDKNEQRMAGELLSQLRSTVKRKSPSMKDHAVFTKIETSILISSAGSHDSGPVVSSGDLASAYRDILELDQLFSCDKCGRYVGKDKYIDHEHKIFCACGQKSLDWTD